MPFRLFKLFRKRGLDLPRTSKIIYLVVGLFFVYIFFLIFLLERNVTKSSYVDGTNRLHKSTIPVLKKPKVNNLYTALLRPWKVEESIRNKRVCDDIKNPKWTMVFVFKSAVKNVARRQTIRETWGSVKMYDDVLFEHVFILGDSNKPEEKRNVQFENNKYGDILQINLEDKAEVVPEKVLAGMQWVSHLRDDCLYASIDDDIIVDHHRLVTYFKRLILDYTDASGNINFLKIPIVCTYSYQDRDPPARNPKSKWFVSKDDYAGMYWPVYCRGGMYTMNRMMAEKLLEASSRIKRVQMDDVWITGLMRVKARFGKKSIVAAPGSQLSDEDLFSTNWPKSSMVHHLWGNIDKRKVDVAQEMKERWADISKAILSNAKCVLSVLPQKDRKVPKISQNEKKSLLNMVPRKKTRRQKKL